MAGVLILFLFLFPVGCVAAPLIYPNVCLRLICVTMLVFTLLLEVRLNCALSPGVAQRNAVQTGRDTGRWNADYQAGIEEAIRQVRNLRYYPFNPFSIVSFSGIVVLAFAPKRSKGSSSKPANKN
jgi:hypothetical protein